MQTAVEANAQTVRKRRPGRQPFSSTQCELPIPPSANALWFNAPGRGRVKTDAYKAWLTEAGWMLREQRVARIPGPVGLTIFAGLAERSRDLDNLLKPIGDLLQANSVIESDARVCEIWARWDKTVPTGRIRLEVRQVLAPALRMSPEARERLSRQKRELQAWLVRQREAMAAKLRDEAKELRRRGEAAELVSKR